MKTVYIITGPIACGKSTLYKYLLEEGIIPNIPFLSNDKFYYESFSGLDIPTEKKYNLAKRKCKEEINKFIKEEKSFVLENVCAKDSKLELINGFKNNGYKIIIYFISVNNVELTIERSIKREENGYLSINEKKIHDRYRRSLNNVRKLMDISDEMYIYDNSGDTIKKIFEKREGRVQILDVEKYIYKYLNFKKMIKLIALDCDGTLLRKDKSISKNTINTIKKLKNQGSSIVLASARPFYRLVKYLRQLDLLSEGQYTISFNGSLIINNYTGEEIFSKTFKKKDIDYILDVSLKFNHNVFLYGKNEIYSNHENYEYKKNNPDVNFNVVDFKTLDFDIVEIYKIVFINSSQKISEIKEKVFEELSDKFELSSSIPQYIEIVNKGVTKSNALEIIGKKLSISNKEMVVFGDRDNDISMMNYAGISIAMGNATDNVKKIASYTTKSNEEDGVSHALKILFKI